MIASRVAVLSVVVCLAAAVGTGQARWPNASFSISSAPPQKGPCAGASWPDDAPWPLGPPNYANACSLKYSTLGQFDDYNFDGFNGAISHICFKAIVNKDVGVGSCIHFNAITEMNVCYAGNCKSHTNYTGPEVTDQGCYVLSKGEYITTVNIYREFREVPPPSTAMTIYFMESSVQLVTSSGRHSQWYGNPNTPNVESPYYHSYQAPTGKHLVSVFGRIASPISFDWAPSHLDQLGVYWGAGGGTGEWVAIQSCPGCSPTSYELKTCTTRTAKDEKSLSNDWSWSTSAELSAGFNFEAISASAKASIGYNQASGIVATSGSSFEVQNCVTVKFACPSAYLWQWQFKSNFDMKGNSVSATAHKVCTDSPQPCCLPLTFTEDPSKCDLAPDSPNLCTGEAIVV